MKTTSLFFWPLITVTSILITGYTMSRSNPEVPLKEKRMMQVGIIVEDIENSCRAWADFLGMEDIPEIMVAAGHESKPTEFMGKPSDATAKLAFFQLENITIELIQPLGGSGTWQEFLDEKGEGIHHIAFDVENMGTSVSACRKLEIPMIQAGGWGTGEYAYLDASAGMGVIIELLEHYNR